MPVDCYRHLNNDTPVVIELPGGGAVTICGDEALDALVRGIRKSNYGLHRILSSYVRQFYDEDDQLERFPREPFASIAKGFLDSGGY